MTTFKQASAAKRAIKAVLRSDPRFVAIGVGEGGGGGFVVVLYGQFSEPLDAKIVSASGGVPVRPQRAERPAPEARHHP